MPTAPAVTEMFKEIRRMIDTPMNCGGIGPGEGFSGRVRCRECLRPAVRPPGFSQKYFCTIFRRIITRNCQSGSPQSTAAMRRTVAKKYLHHEQMILICVGDRAKIEPELKKLELGAIELRDADGKIIQ